MQTPKWRPNMSNIDYLAYVMACNYFGIQPKPQY